MSLSKTENRFLPASSLKTTGEVRPKASLLATDGFIRPPLTPAQSAFPPEWIVTPVEIPRSCSSERRLHFSITNQNLIQNP